MAARAWRARARRGARRAAPATTALCFEPFPKTDVFLRREAVRSLPARSAAACRPADRGGVRLRRGAKGASRAAQGAAGLKPLLADAAGHQEGDFLSSLPDWLNPDWILKDSGNYAGYGASVRLTLSASKR